MISLKNKITKIEIQKKRKDRVNVYINNEYSFSCSAELVFSHSLKKDIEVDIEYLKKITDEENYMKCKNDGLRAIEKSYKTEKEIITKLIKKEHSEESIKRTIEFLKQYNFVDDYRYVDLFIKERIKKQGKKKIKYELLKKGIEENIINDKIDDINDEYEISIMDTLARKKYRILIKSEEDSFKIYNKMFNYLARLGYNNTVISKVVKNILGDMSEEHYNSENTIKKKKQSCEEIETLARKRYNIIIKHESDSMKVYSKLWRFLINRGYSNEDVKRELKKLRTID
ncbi:recombination regulator RecX [Clostridium arbusti]|uniref:recombination regulator RecX n=1 Tax=Clostridium arbusti TaxID=1137848 RepID=UPI0035A25C7A